MTTLREAAQQALEALAAYRREMGDRQPCDAETALRAALAQQEEPVEPVAEVFVRRDGVSFAFWLKAPPPERTKLYTAPPQRLPQTLDEAMQQPSAMAQAYEAGYKAGVAHEREACAKVCERYELARSAAAAIRVRGEQP